MVTYKVGYFVGSLSSTSINRLLAKALGRLAPPELVLNEIPIKDLPLYSPDFDADYPPVARALKQSIADVDAVLFVTPEYNRSIPGGLKNAIDWASRPWGKNSFARKPTGVIGTSPGAIGTAVAQQSLRGVLCYCNSPLMNQVEAYIQFKPGLITANGEVTDEPTQEFLRNYMVTVLGEYIDHHVKEEEGEMFSKARQADIDSELLGEELVIRKAELKEELGIVEDESVAGKSTAAGRKSKPSSARK